MLDSNHEVNDYKSEAVCVVCQENEIYEHCSRPYVCIKCKLHMMYSAPPQDDPMSRPISPNAYLPDPVRIAVSAMTPSPQRVASYVRSPAFSALPSNFDNMKPRERFDAINAYFCCSMSGCDKEYFDFCTECPKRDDAHYCIEHLPHHKHFSESSSSSSSSSSFSAPLAEPVPTVSSIDQTQVSIFLFVIRLSEVCTAATTDRLCSVYLY